MGKVRTALIATTLPLTCVLAIYSAPRAIAQADDERQYNIPAQDLATSLRVVAQRSGISITAPAGLLIGKTASALEGRYTVEQAVARLIADRGLRYDRTEEGIVIRWLNAVNGAQSGGTESVGSGASDAIVVTGSLIRGAPIASTVIHISREDMVRSGQSSLTDLVRALPQGFGGGINVGVGQNTGGDNGDYGGASTFNLRGLGTDATLTLLNGRRLAYNGARQGVDVSVVPLGAVERVEILPDGASALYGSDAVAGVANIILRKDFDGFRVEADGGFATQGDYNRQRYGATAGQIWGSGGFILSYEYARSTGLMSNDRSFASGRPGVVIYPPLARHAIIASAHQALSGTLTAAVDLLFNRRATTVVSAANPQGDLAISRSAQTTHARAYAIAPSLTLELADDWRATLSAVYGNDRSQTQSASYFGDEQFGPFGLCYCNSGKSAEMAAEGALFDLPGGTGRVALGAGYRSNSLNVLNQGSSPSTVHVSQDSYYGYGELSLPVVSPDLNIPAIHRLNLSAALRYEHYRAVDSVITPKFGVVFAPTSLVDIKGSWGRAFRAPSLLQQYGPPRAALYPADALGGQGLATDATALLLYGGNMDLKPERATSWTASVDFHPLALPGFRSQISYFNTRYSGRIVDPMPFVSNALGDPIYNDLVARAPSLSLVADSIARSAQFFNNTGGPFDPAQVAAIIDDRYRNAGQQRIHGLDLLANYSLPWKGGTLSATLNASYLQFTQRLTANQPVISRAGVLFSPPHWRGVATAGWTRDGTSLDATISVTGGVDDIRTAQNVRIGGMTTLDLTARHRLQRAGGVLRNLELTLSVMNAFDAKPRRIASTSFYDSTYDSTNYLPLGRIVNLGIARSW